MQALELGDRPAELFAALDVVEPLVIGAGRKAERDRPGADPLAVVGVHQVGEALAQAARRDHHHGRRDLHVLEMDLGLWDAAQAHRRLAPAGAQAGRLVADRG